LSAKENLSYYCKVFGISQENADKFLQKVKLENAANKKFKEFSLGMKQRLGLALALMGNPELVILDEPTNGLDPVGISELREIIKKLNEEGVTFLICSHILSELSQIATKFGIVHNGHFVKELTKEELLELTSDKIIVETTQPEKLSAFLTNKKLPFCENGNIFEIEDKNAKVNDLVAAIVKNKIIIEAIYKKKVSLEEVFLDILNNKEEVAQND
jgi:ABC-2 type transport system ATP-binding protein